MCVVLASGVPETATPNYPSKSLILLCFVFVSGLGFTLVQREKGKYSPTSGNLFSSEDPSVLEDIPDNYRAMPPRGCTTRSLALKISHLHGHSRHIRPPGSCARERLEGVRVRTKIPDPFAESHRRSIASSSFSRPDRSITRPSYALPYRVLSLEIYQYG